MPTDTLHDDFITYNYNYYRRHDLTRVSSDIQENRISLPLDARATVVQLMVNYDTRRWECKVSNFDKTTMANMIQSERYTRTENRPQKETEDIV